jgi:hypothetical protein
MGFLRNPANGAFSLVYRLPDGGQVQCPPSTDMTDEQRAENIERIQKQLGLVAQNRKHQPGAGDPRTPKTPS